MQQHKDYMAGLLHHTASSNVVPLYVKGKAVPLHAKKVQRGGKGTALPILNPGTWRGWVVTDINQAALSEGIRPGTHCTGDWLGLRTNQDG